MSHVHVCTLYWYTVFSPLTNHWLHYMHESEKECLFYFNWYIPPFFLSVPCNVSFQQNKTHRYHDLCSTWNFSQLPIHRSVWQSTFDNSITTLSLSPFHGTMFSLCEHQAGRKTTFVDNIHIYADALHGKVKNIYQHSTAGRFNQYY